MADFSSSLVLLLIAGTVFVIAVLTMAWFAKNLGTDSDSVSTSANGALFELGVVASGDDRADPVDDAALDVLSGLTDRNYDRDALETTDQGNVICSLVSDDGHPLRPGSSGTLQFRVIPKQDDFYFGAATILSGLKKVVNPLDPTDITYEPLDVENDPDEALAMDCLKGHLLFFTSSTHSALNLFDPEDGFVITGADDSTEEYLVTLYWEWPRIYDDHDRYVDAAWKTAHSAYLQNGTGDLGYNNADQLIGEHVAYVVAEISVDPLTAAPAGVTQIAATAIP